MKLEALETLEKESTPGPWDARIVTIGKNFRSKTVVGASPLSGPAQAKKNAELIQGFRNAAPDLLAMVRASLEVNRLLAEGKLVRDISNDHDTKKFLDQSLDMVTVLKAFAVALDKFKE